MVIFRPKNGQNGNLGNTNIKGVIEPLSWLILPFIDPKMDKMATLGKQILKLT